MNKHLTLEQRYTISVMIQNKYSQIDIAKTIGKHKFVVL
ncbi:MAG: helix-turn-helix domain-containing protein [Saprospiraceae bacterium]